MGKKFILLFYWTILNPLFSLTQSDGMDMTTPLKSNEEDCFTNNNTSVHVLADGKSVGNIIGAHYAEKLHS